MIELKFNRLTIDEFIQYALAEDMGDGDHTSLSTIDFNNTGTAYIKIKEEGIVSGIEVAKKVFYAVDPNLNWDLHVSDGEEVQNGKIAITVKGNVRSLLKAERLVLNFMQRMSGIATLTKSYVRAIDGTRAKILDTRKTTPNFREFEKQAVLDGGGTNHRFGLYDMILIKDNHVDAARGIRNALNKTDEYLKSTGRKLQVEIETRNLKEVQEVIETGIANRIMLDNFEPTLLKKAVDMIGNKFETEASGGITLINIKEYALTGVQFISVGALTHSYKSLDISMKLERR
jgi:nicotinate-nucleotide pyrophosphorylase (carboxylating)